MRYLFLIAGLVAIGIAACGGETAEPLKPAQAVPAGQFLFACTFDRAISDDPIVHPGMPGMAHQTYGPLTDAHSFAGAKNVDAFSTYSSMESGATTCPAPELTAGYWMPSLYTAAGALVAPSNISVYYRDLGRDNVQPFPPVSHVQGNANNADPNKASGAWRCVKTGSTYSVYIPKTCPAGTNTVENSIYFPACWNGKELDNATHKTLGACGLDFPVPVPQIQQFARYPIAAVGGRLACDNPATPGKWGLCMHADYKAAADPIYHAKLVQACLNENRSCRWQNGKVVDVNVSPPAPVPGF